jgi:SAM-dependent methyltransferase
MLQLAAAKATAARLTNVEFRQADATCTGLPDRLFDAVVCVFGVFFAQDMRAFTEEMWRMVAPGGMLAVTTWGPELFEPANRQFWDVTVDALSVEARSRVRHRVLDRLRMNKITTVRTDVIYSIGRRPPLSRYARLNRDSTTPPYQPSAHRPAW